MIEYTWSDIIVDPESDRAKEAVGKEVYYGDIPSEALLNAKANLNIGVLLDIDLDEIYPFKIKREIDDNADYSLIILKKEEPKPKYIPFESPEEFIEAYGDHTHPDKDSEIDNVLDMSDMWLINTRKEKPAVEQVIAVRDKSVSFRKSIWTYAGLLEFFTFPDGTPCGKLREESNA